MTSESLELNGTRRSEYIAPAGQMAKLARIGKAANQAWLDANRPLDSTSSGSGSSIS